MVTIKNPLTIVKTGGGPTPPTPPTPTPLDPEEVYAEKRPANWLKMPTPADDEYFLLLDVGDNLVDTLPVAVQVSNSPDWTLELGTTDVQGVFTADPDLVATGTGTKTISVPANKWQDVGSTRQLMARVKINTFSSASAIAEIAFNQGYMPLSVFKNYLVELSGRSSGRSRTTGFPNYRRLMFFSLAGELPAGTSFSQMFYNCTSLTAIPELDTSSGTNFSQMFSGCTSLTAIPELDTSSGTNFSSMFSGCYSLTAIPELDTSSGTSFSSMFYYCTSLTAIPELDTSSGTNFSSMFYNCYSLTAIPELDTSSGINFSQMFYNCISLTAADLTGYDFSAVTSTTALSSVLNTINGTNLTIDFGDTFGTNGIRNTGAIISGVQNTSADYPCKVRINKTDAMLQIAANATTLFSGTYVYVYVPDGLLATYQADTYWATLGTRLKPMSEWSA